MVTLQDILQIRDIQGVDEYILVNHKGQVMAHDIEQPEQVAKMVLVCAQNSWAIAKTRLKYTIFSRKSKKDILIFPVGNFNLGVVKHQTMNDMIFASKVIQFLNNLLNKKID